MEEEMKTNKVYQKQKIITKEGEIAHGSYSIFNDDGSLSYTIHCTNGLLDDPVDENGNLIPAFFDAYETHIEHWKNGVLHCAEGPAVIDLLDGYEEWWYEGRIVEDQDSDD